MIDDPELRSLFRSESEEHLQALESGLLHLEAQPEDTTVLDHLFRSAHSLKGAARMLGVDRLEKLAHHFEDELGAARRGRRAISSAAADRLYQGLDAMRRLSVEACGGEDAQVDIVAVLARLRGESPAEQATFRSESNENRHESGSNAMEGTGEGSRDRPQPEGDEPVTEAREEGLAPLEAVAAHDMLDLVDPIVGEQPEFQPLTTTTFKIETIRVEPQKLDALMTLAGEMAVTTARAVKALTVIDELVELWEEGSRYGDPRGATPTLGNREANQSKQMRDLLRRLERTGDEEMSRLGLVANQLVESITDLRQLPFSTIFNLFPRTVRDLSHEQGKEVELEVVGGEVTADKHLLEELKDPLMHMIRNAIDHGIEAPEERIELGKPLVATIRLKAFRIANRMAIEISDDGRGLIGKAIGEAAVRKHLLTENEVAELSPEALQRLIFTPGFTTTSLITDVSGRGVGLDVVRINVERLKGTITVDSIPGLGSTFRIEAPIGLATTRVLLVRLREWTYAVPIDSIEKTFLLSSKSIFSIEGRSAARWEDEPVWIAPLADLLELPPAGKKNREDQDRPGILLSIGSERVALFVDGLLDEQEVIIKPLGAPLKRVRNVLGSTILSTGEVCMILNPHDLIKSMQKQRLDDIPKPPNPHAERKKVILLAEDSITTRTQEKRILESAGYEVVTAVDGAEAFGKLSSRPFDAVVSDVEMPNMSGLQLAERIRRDPQYKELPIILVTSLATDQDRKHGVDVGANAYITKGTFDQKLLLDTLRRLV
jgi:two-component system chemotaxis sensor kinase CheA